MAALVGVYANKLKIHGEFKSYDNDSVFNYITNHLRFLVGRGKESLKYTFFKDGKQKIVSGPYNSDRIAEKIKGVETLKGTGMITKVQYKKLRKSLSTTSIDGHFINKNELKKGPHQERFTVFDKKFSSFIDKKDYGAALKFANMYLNGSLLKETEDSIIGIRTASGYKPLFLMEAEDDGNDFVTISSEDCVSVPLTNCEVDTGSGEFQGMDLKVRPFQRGELVKLDKDGLESFVDVKDPSGSGMDIEAAYDPHEAIYTMNKNSTWEGNPVVNLRKSLGKNLFSLYREDLEKADLIGYVPDSPIDIAIGMQEASGIPNDEVLQKDRYNRRSPQRGYGDRGQSDLLLMSEDVIRGKNTVVVDDSVIEGNHLKIIKNRMKNVAKNVIIVSAEIPIIEENQAGFYSETRDLLARDMLTSASSIRDLNAKVSEWSEMDVYYNTAKNISKSLGVKVENLGIPGILKYKGL